MSPFEHGEVFVLDDSGEVSSFLAIQKQHCVFPFETRCILDCIDLPRCMYWFQL